MNMEEMEVNVSDEEVAREVALGVIGRAQQLHENPDDSAEEVALELREVGQQLLDEYSDSYSKE